MRDSITTLLQMLLLSTSVGAAACTTRVDGNNVSETYSAIYGSGGEIDEGDPAVVYLETWEDNGPSRSKGFCTGSLIAPNVVLTAAHCVARQYREGFRVFFGSSPTEDGPWFKVKIVDFAAGYSFSPEQTVHDIGIAVLESPAPDSLEPLPINRTPLTDAIVGSSGRVVGYGVDEEGNDGIKRQTAVPINSVDDVVLASGSQDHVHAFGDSGGPLFAAINGVETIVGVNSTCAVKPVDGWNQCVEGIHARVDRDLELIDRYVGP